MSEQAAFLAALRAGGVTCADENDPNGWVDDTADRIRDALLAAGWAPPGRTVELTVLEGDCRCDPFGCPVHATDLAHSEDPSP